MAILGTDPLMENYLALAVSILIAEIYGMSKDAIYNRMRRYLEKRNLKRA